MTHHRTPDAPLPRFTVRRSARARSARLVVSARDGLVVVVPQRWRGDPAQLVAGRIDWAERALAHVAEDRALFEAGAEALLPSTIHLKATGATHVVEYRAAPGHTRVRAEGESVIVAGDVEDGEACLAALRRWLHTQAHHHLEARCHELAGRVGVDVTRVRVSSARARWGSCSATGSISLNRALMFVEAELVDALILHEVAHLTHLNHSEAYWAHLATLDPRHRDHRRSMRHAWAQIPLWARPDAR